MMPSFTNGSRVTWIHHIDFGDISRTKVGFIKFHKIVVNGSPCQRSKIDQCVREHRVIWFRKGTENKGQVAALPLAFFQKLPLQLSQYILFYYPIYKQNIILWTPQQCAKKFYDVGKRFQRKWQLFIKT